MATPLSARRQSPPPMTRHGLGAGSFAVGWRGLVTSPVDRGKAVPQARPCVAMFRPRPTARDMVCRRERASPWQGLAKGLAILAKGPAARGKAVPRAGVHFAGVATGSAAPRARRRRRDCRSWRGGAEGTAAGSAARGKALPKARLPSARPCHHEPGGRSSGVKCPAAGGEASSGARPTLAAAGRDLRPRRAVCPAAPGNTSR